MKKILISCIAIILTFGLVSCDSDTDNSLSNEQDEKNNSTVQEDSSISEEYYDVDFSATESNVHLKVKEIIEGMLVACKQDDFDRFLDLQNLDLLMQVEPEDTREAVSESEKDDFNDFSQLYKNNSSFTTEITLKLYDEPNEDDEIINYEYSFSIIGDDNVRSLYMAEALFYNGEVSVYLMELENQ